MTQPWWETSADLTEDSWRIRFARTVRRIADWIEGIDDLDEPSDG